MLKTVVLFIYLFIIYLGFFFFLVETDAFFQPQIRKIHFVKFNKIKKCDLFILFNLLLADTSEKKKKTFPMFSYEISISNMQ